MIYQQSYRGGIKSIVSEWIFKMYWKIFNFQALIVSNSIQFTLFCFTSHNSTFSYNSDCLKQKSFSTIFHFNWKVSLNCNSVPLSSNCLNFMNNIFVKEEEGQHTVQHIRDLTMIFTCFCGCRQALYVKLCVFYKTKCSQFFNVNHRFNQSAWIILSLKKNIHLFNSQQQLSQSMVIK